MAAPATLEGGPLTTHHSPLTTHPLLPHSKVAYLLRTAYSLLPTMAVLTTKVASRRFPEPCTVLASLLRHLGVPVPERPEGYSLEDTRHAHAELLSAAREGAPDRILAALEQVLHLVPLCYTPLPPFTLASRNPLPSRRFTWCYTPLSYASPSSPSTPPRAGAAPGAHGRC